MKNLEKSFKSYLREVGKIGEISLGEQQPTVQSNQLFFKELEGRANSNNIFVISAVILLFILFGIGVFLILHYRGSLQTTGILVGGLFFCLGGIVKKLRQLWLEKFIIDHASYVLQNSSPEQAAEFILLIHGQFFSKSDT